MRQRLELERNIERRFLSRLRELWPTAKTRKLNGYGNSSWPDRMILLPETPVFFIEFKRSGGVLSPGQAHEIKELKSLGLRVFVCDDAEQAIIYCQAEVMRASRS